MAILKRLFGAGWVITTVTSLVFAVVFNLILLTSEVLLSIASKALEAVAVSTVYSKKNKQLDNGRKALKRTNSRIVARTFRGLGRTVVSIPAEAAPIIGAGFVVGTAFWEVSDGCLTLADIEDLYTEFGVEPDMGGYQKACVKYKEKVDGWIKIFGDENIGETESMAEGVDSSDEL